MFFAINVLKKGKNIFFVVVQYFISRYKRERRNIEFILKKIQKERSFCNFFNIFQYFFCIFVKKKYYLIYFKRKEIFLEKIHKENNERNCTFE